MAKTVKSTGESKHEKRYGSVRMTVSLSSVIFPIDFAELTQALKKKQYNIQVDLPPAGIGRRVGGTGIIAKKGEVSVVADSDRRYIGVDGRAPNDVLSSFEELTQILNDELWVDVHTQSVHYEVIIRLNALSRGNPTTAIAKFYSNLEGTKAFESIIGEPISFFTLRLVPKDKLPSGSEWFDIKLEPDVSRPEHTYTVEVVYRKASYKHVEEFINTVDQKIEAMLSELE